MKIGVLLPPSAAFEGIRRAIGETLSAFFDEINARGGIYGRRLVLSSMVYPDAPSRHIFHLAADLPSQAAALTRFALRLTELRQPAVWLVCKEGDQAGRMKAAGARQIREAGWSRPREIPLHDGASPDWSALLGNGKADAVFWLAPGSLLPDFFAKAENGSARPFVFTPAALASREAFAAPPGFSGQLYLSFPTLPSDQSPQGREEFVALAKRGRFSAGGLSTRLATISAAKLLVHRLREAGKEVRREKLTQFLENVDRFRNRPLP